MTERHVISRVQGAAASRESREGKMCAMMALHDRQAESKTSDQWSRSNSEATCSFNRAVFRVHASTQAPA